MNPSENSKSGFAVLEPSTNNEPVQPNADDIIDSMDPTLMALIRSNYELRTRCGLLMNERASLRMELIQLRNKIAQLEGK